MKDEIKELIISAFQAGSKVKTENKKYLRKLAFRHYKQNEEAIQKLSASKPTARRKNYNPKQRRRHYLHRQLRPYIGDHLIVKDHKITGSAEYFDKLPEAAKDYVEQLQAIGYALQLEVNKAPTEDQAKQILKVNG